MALPDGITLVTVQVGPPMDFNGDLIPGGLLTVKPATSLVHAASGTAILARPQRVPLDDSGMASVVLPATDQDGFVDGEGGKVKDWTYLATWSFKDKSVPAPKPFAFALPAATPFVDLDLLTPCATSTGVNVAVPVVTSVNGASGAVELLDPVQAGYARARALRRWHAAYSTADTKRAQMLYIGDSLPAGFAQTRNLMSYPNIVHRKLRAARGLPAGARSAISPAQNFYDNAVGHNIDAPTVCAGASAYPTVVNGYGRDGSSCYLFTGDSTTITFTGTGFDLGLTTQLDFGNANVGQVSVKVDGAQVSWTGAVSAPNLAAGSAAIASFAAPQAGGKAAVGVYSMRNLTRGTHSVKVTGLSGVFIVNELTPYDGDEAAGIGLVTACVGGQPISSYWDTNPAAASRYWLDARLGVDMKPDLVVIDNIDNDASGMLTAARHFELLDTLIPYMSAKLGYDPSIVLQINQGFEQKVGDVTSRGLTITDPVESYWQNFYDLAAKYPNVTVFNVAERLVEGGKCDMASTYDGLITPNAGDHLHFTDTGSEWVAQLSLDFLLPRA